MDLTLGELERDNGVYEALGTLMPGASESALEAAFGMSARDDIKLHVMTRKRYRWDMGCEKATVLKSRYFMETLWRVRQYFYPIDLISKFPGKHSGSHSHTFIKEYPWLHNDEH